MDRPSPLLVTTLDAVAQPSEGVILPHEHAFVDLRTPGTPGHAEADTAAVVALMAPIVRAAKSAGVAAPGSSSTTLGARTATRARAICSSAASTTGWPTGCC